MWCGDQWDHVAFDPDSRLVLGVVVGKRVTENVAFLLEGVKRRLGGRAPALVTNSGMRPPSRPRTPSSSSTALSARRLPTTTSRTRRLSGSKATWSH